MADVPARPALAHGVELAGQQQDSAYERQPWLILRRGAYLQVTELLYRLAEAMTGDRDHDEIARVVSDSIGRTVTPDNVRQLLERKLIPMGLVPLADGSVLGPSASGGRSPLQISLRTAQIPPRVLVPLAGAFKILFAPPIVLVVLGVAGAAIGWVLVVHGLGAGVHGALYAPWLVLALLPIIVASAAFHEFGHAAALAYGGGKVRGMGAGIYLVYPVFFTDVTDNYRLGRSARVRTDLGGFYFNLIFALGVLVAFVATGQDFLLLGIVAIVFGIIHQLLPIVRLDGYWALADLTGIPDPFSAMKPFVRSLVPLPGRRTATPGMKAWVKGVFLVYIIVTVPLLLALLFYTVAIAPRIIGTTLDSLGRQATDLQAALGAGDAVGVAARVAGIGVLALTIVGIIVFLFRTGRAALSALTRWAGESWPRRAIARTVAMGAAGALVVLWAPPLPMAGLPPGPFHNFAPLTEGERVPLVTALDVGGASASAPTPTASPDASPTGHPTSGPSDPPASPQTSGSTVAPGPSATPTPRPPGDPTIHPAPTRTPAPTPSPTPAPTAPTNSPSPASVSPSPSPSPSRSDGSPSP